MPHLRSFRRGKYLCLGFRAWGTQVTVPLSLQYNPLGLDFLEDKKWTFQYFQCWRTSQTPKQLLVSLVGTDT